MISVVIPNFNGGKQLAKNLPRLFELLDKSKLQYEVIAVDDASTDDSVQKLEDLRSKIKTNFQITKLEKNRGFASTVDAGIRAAKGEIVFTLKTDALPDSADYFRLMLDHFDFMKKSSFPKKTSLLTFAVSAALKTVEKGKTEIRGCGEIYFEKGFFLHRRGGPEIAGGPSARFADATLAQDARTSKVKYYSAWADGGAMAVRRDLYLKIGGFDKLYNPFYWEDVDLGYRAWKAGYQIDFEPKAVLLHDFEAGAIARHYSSQQVRIISQRNQFVFVWKNADFKHLLFYAFWEPYHVAIAIKNRDWDFFRAYWQAVFKLPGILMARWRQKKVGKLSDDEVLTLFLDEKTPR